MNGIEFSLFALYYISSKGVIDMKQTIWLFIAGMALVAAAAARVTADPAKDIIMQFDDASKKLTISVIHGSKNPQMHFIEAADVFLNGKKIVHQSMKSQTDNQQQGISYVVIDAKPGDEITVDSECNIMGRLKKKLVVGGAAQKK
jgi:hypothetical protein